MNPLDRVAGWAADTPQSDTTIRSAVGQTRSGDFDVESFIEGHGLKLRHHDRWKGGEKWELKVCPFNPEHTDACAVITRGSNGALGFKCQHRSCTGIGWTELRERLEPGYRKSGGGANSNLHESPSVVPVTVLPGPVEEVALRNKWRAYRPHELAQECARTGHRYMIDGLIPERSLGLLVGDSGLGKSPLAYQMGICVAAAVPFLGASVQQGVVLYLDFENGLQDVNFIIARLSTHLGLATPPDDLLLWNVNDCLSNWNALKAFEMIRDVKPGLVFIDPISALYPKAERTNEDATTLYQDFRKLIHDCGCSIVNLHHRKKPPSPKPGQSMAVPSLEDDNFRSWFLPGARRWRAREWSGCSPGG